MFRQSSYLVGLEMAASGDTFADSGLEPAKFAGVGGCFPINLKGRGFIGAIAVSGMEQQEDHWLVVDSQIKQQRLFVPDHQIGISGGSAGF